MKNSIIKAFNFSIQSIGIAGIAYTLLTTVSLSRDNQDTLNEMADRLNNMQNQVQSNSKAIKTTSAKILIQKPVIIHQRHTNVFHIDQWLGSKKK